MRPKRNTGSSRSWRGDARHSPFDGKRWSRDESWSRDKQVGEVWPRFTAEIPPELAEALVEAQRKSLGVNWDGYSGRPRNATNANLVRAGLRLYLNTVDPEPGEAIEGTAVEMVDLPAIEAPSDAPISKGGLMLTGNGWGTGSQQTIWFCHLCHWSGVLPAGVPHVCKPPSPRKAD